MRIVHLIAENVKKLKVVDITPAGDVVQITGRNGSGKSSVLDAIWWAIGGAGGVQQMPIRRGQETARVRLDLGEIIVTRKFTDKGSALVVENAEGARFPSPQKMLDGLIGELSFDPLAFSKMDPAAQCRELKRVAKIDADLDALDCQNAADFNRRTALNREAKEQRTRAAGYTFRYEPAAGCVDVDALITQLQNAAQHNADVDAQARRREADAENLTSYETELANAERRVETLRLKVAAQREKVTTTSPLPEKVAVDELRSLIADGQARNAEHGRREEQARLLAAATAAESAAETLTNAMAARNAEKAQAMAAAQMPIPGLSLEGGRVLLDGVPFDQASSAEQLRTSVAIAMAANPKLKIVRIKDGSLLDDDGLRIIESLAGDNGYQVWIERVDSSGKIGVVMEDGEVKASK